MPPEKPARRISRWARYRLRWRRLRKRLERQALATPARLLLRDPNQVTTRQPATTSSFGSQRFPVGSIVAFRDRRGRTIRGKVAELRPQDALVAASDDGRYRVPYMTLRLIAPGPRGGATLAEIEALAADLLRTHELPGGLGPGWRFHFETTANRAGVCRHAAKTIAMAVSYVLRAGWPDIRGTLLHEITHSIVGPTPPPRPRLESEGPRDRLLDRALHHAHARRRPLDRPPREGRTWVRHRLTARLRRGVGCGRCGSRLAWKPNTDGVTG